MTTLIPSFSATTDRLIPSVNTSSQAFTLNSLLYLRFILNTPLFSYYIFTVRRVHFYCTTFSAYLFTFPYFDPLRHCVPLRWRRLPDGVGADALRRSNNAARRAAGSRPYGVEWQVAAFAAGAQKRQTCLPLVGAHSAGWQQKDPPQNRGNSAAGFLCRSGGFFTSKAASDYSMT